MPSNDGRCVTRAVRLEEDCRRNGSGQPMGRPGRRSEPVNLERIEITPIAVLVGDIVRGRRTGTLTIVRPSMRKVLYWSQGELVLLTSSSPEDSLADCLVRRGVINMEQAVKLAADDPTEAVEKFHEAGVVDLSTRQTLLREWMIGLAVPLFSLEEGTAAFTEGDAIGPEKRVFLQSTAAVVLQGVRAITNGLVLRRSLGDLKREIAISRESPFTLDSIPLSDAEQRIALSLREPQTIEAFLKQFAAESVIAAKLVIGMLALGIFSNIESSSAASQQASIDDTQRDLELLAAIGAGDQRSLRAVSLARQLVTMDHYQFLDVPRAATRAMIVKEAEEMKRRYDPATFPPIARDAISAIHRRIDEAAGVLRDPTRRASYDKLLGEHGDRAVDDDAMRRRATQHSIAEQNCSRARELAVNGDYYGAIVFLRQAVKFEPDYAEAWFLLGNCQQRNPRWTRDAAESYQRVLSIDPNHVEALISLGDLYRSEGFVNRAQTCYEDVLKINAANQQAKNRLADMARRR
jgi:tetratricopeptide (TPR) repeat protein